MASELITGLGIFKTLLDMTKGLKDLNDAAVRNGAVIELMEKIIAAKEQQTTLLEHIGELEKEVADLKAWKGEKQQYELKNVDVGALAYIPKPNTSAAEVPHWLCANCGDEGKKKYLQITRSEMYHNFWSCPECKNLIKVRVRISPEDPKGDKLPKVGM